MKPSSLNWSRVVGSVLVALLALSMIYWMGCNERANSPIQPANTQESGNLSKANSQIQAVVAVQSRYTEELMAISDVVGTGVGADPDGKPILLILAKREGVPNLPTVIEGVRTRVDVVGEIRAMGKGYKGAYRPVPGGVSVGNDNECAAGTIGCTVFKGSTPYALSNNHVFARINAASIGERIDQPGRYDGKPICSQTGQVATLSDFVKIDFSKQSTNVVDCGIAEYKGVSYTCSMVDNLYTPSSTFIPPSVGLAVKKVGRTSGLTHGTIAGTNVTIQVNYGDPGVATFVNQIYVASTFIRSGDSGSLMVSETGNNPVGLNFAGGSRSSFANPIGQVLQQLGVTICSQ